MFLENNKYLPSNKNAISEVCDLLNYFCEIKNKYVITGQHTQTVKQEELKYIKRVTNKLPKLIGYELLGYSLNINKDSDSICLDEVKENLNTIEVALKDDRIITFTWHMFSPLYGLGKSFYAEKTEFDPRKILDNSTAEYNAFMNELKHMAILLTPFKEKNKPFLFRPFHESDGKWFWWGRYGADVAKELYIMTYKYFTFERGFNNIIWVWNAVNSYPGDEYVDIISVDVYTEPHEKTNYFNEINELINKTTKNKLVALAECGVIPDITLLEKANFPFIYYMLWSKEFILTEKYNTKEELKKMFNSKYSIKA
ncbi:MAG: glycoside hydrolase family 26 protein [bacterium]|nr:glycoside hydrolase family 26 protein [bacterium]